MNKLETVLAELKRLDAEATPGPWHIVSTDGTDFTAISTELGSEELEHEVLGASEWLRIKESDLYLLSTYRNQTPKLIKVIEKLIEQRDELLEGLWSDLNRTEERITASNKEIESILEGE